MNRIVPLIRSLLLVAVCVDCTPLSREALAGLKFHHCFEIAEFACNRSLKVNANRIDNICFSKKGAWFHFVSSDDGGKTLAMVLRNNRIRFVLFNEDAIKIELYPAMKFDEGDNTGEFNADWTFVHPSDIHEFYKDMYVNSAELENWNYTIKAIRTVEIIDDESDSGDEDNMKYKTLAERVKLYSETVVRDNKEEKLFTFRKIKNNQEEIPVVIVLQREFRVARPNLYGVKVALQIKEFPKRHYILELENMEKAISLYDRLKEYARHPDRRFAVSDDVREYM